MCIETSIQIKIVLSWYKATFTIFKNRLYFSVMSIALNDVNVRGGGGGGGGVVMSYNHLHEKLVPVKSLYRYSR